MSKKHYKLLFERVPENEIIKHGEGVNGVVAVTKSNVYMVRGMAVQRKTIKTYAIKNIASIDMRKPSALTNGHFQIITSGNSDGTKTASAFSYAKDENTVMISKNNYEDFLELERLIYELRDSTSDEKQPVASNEEDVFEKIEKLAELNYPRKNLNKRKKTC